MKKAALILAAMGLLSSCQSGFSLGLCYENICVTAATPPRVVAPAVATPAPKTVRPVQP